MSIAKISVSTQTAAASFFRVLLLLYIVMPSSSSAEGEAKKPRVSISCPPLNFNLDAAQFFSRKEHAHLRPACRLLHPTQILPIFLHHSAHAFRMIAHQPNLRRILCHNNLAFRKKRIELKQLDNPPSRSNESAAENDTYTRAISLCAHFSGAPCP